MERPALTVVIPTHQRPDILKKCLEHLVAQTIATEIEVIVVHDGTDDRETRNILRGSARHGEAPRRGHEPLRGAPQDDTYEFPLRYCAIAKSQQGIARNEGVKHATAPITLFIGDDIFLAPNACEKHLAAHRLSPHLNPPPSGEGGAQRREGEAVLGFTTWDPRLDITPVMRWLEKTGWQFGYPMIKRYKHAFIPRDMQERFTYTSHISVPTAIAKKFPFRTDVALYGWEDILWGKQLKEAGIPLFYESDALGLHHHRITTEDSLTRMETLGHSLVQLTKIDPALGRMPRGWKLLAYRLLALTPTMRGAHYRAFLRGMDKNL